MKDSPVEADAERDRAIAAALPHVPALGWTMAAVRAGLTAGGGDREDAALLFPNGPGELVAGYADMIDRAMAADAAASDMVGRGTTGRVRAVIALRLVRLRPHRDAIRLAAGLLVLPHMALWGARAARASVDAVWHAAGEALDDATRHTKRATLAMVMTSTMLFWLRNGDSDDTATLAFLDRRLADVGRIGKLRAKVGNMFNRRTSRA